MHMYCIYELWYTMSGSEMRQKINYVPKCNYWQNPIVKIFHAISAELAEMHEASKYSWGRVNYEPKTVCFASLFKTNIYFGLVGSEICTNTSFNVTYISGRDKAIIKNYFVWVEEIHCLHDDVDEVFLQYNCGYYFPTVQ